MLTLEPLYKRTRTGAIQTWIISTAGNIISKNAGQLNGKLTTHFEECEPKNVGRANETTAEQQAESQARSDWNKKRDEGYKSLKDLNITIVGPTIEAIQRNPNDPAIINYFKRVTELLEEKLPQFNTDASGQLKPMLAPTKPFSKGKAKYPGLLEKKLDGVRTTCVLNPVTEEIKFLSRSGKDYTTIGHLDIAIRSSNFDLRQLPGITILDGEIYKHGWTLEEINEAVKKYRPGTTEQLEFWIYDLPLLDTDQEARSKAVVNIVARINHPNIRHEAGVPVNSDDEVIALHDEWVQEGFEGAMLKNPKGTYQPGQRSSFWSKVKMFDDSEFKVISYKLGQRGVEDILFVCECPGGKFDVKMSGDRASKQRLFDKIDKLIGTQLTVKHFGLSKYNIPNLPVGKAFRHE
jgi:ATP-dependent DNA ligase